MARGGWGQWAKPKLYTAAYCRMTRENVARVCEEILTTPYDEILEIAKDTKEIGLIQILARSMVAARKTGDFRSLDRVLNRVIGPVRQDIMIVPPVAADNGKPTFEEFCERAGYPTPYPKQIEMMDFGANEIVPRLMLGSRGYGKTDYVVILGTAWKIFCNRNWRVLLITKSDQKNAAILGEIAKALLANGVSLEKNSASAVRVSGLQGKDHSIASISLGSASLRGRHPDQVIMDDPVTEEDVSPAVRKRAERVYSEAMKLVQNVLVIGQPVHKFDLYESLRGILKKMEVPHGTIPELDHDIEAMRLAGVSEESISASYKLKVISESGFPLELVSSLPDYPAGDSVAFIDPAYEGADYTALTIGRAHMQGVVVKGRMWRRAWYNCVDEMCAEFEAQGVRKVCFETNMVGEQPVTLLRSVVPEGIGVIGRPSIGNKHSRIAAMGPFAKSIFIADTSDKLYKDQVRKYEHGAKHDDAPDSLAGLLEWIGLIRGKSTK